MYDTIIGWLRQITGDDSYVFDFEDGRPSVSIELLPTNTVIPPINTKIAMSVIIPSEDADTYALSAQDNCFTYVSEALGDLPAKKQKHILVCNKAPMDATPEQLDNLLDIAEDTALSLKHFMLYHGWKQWSVDTKGIVYQGEQATKPPGFAQGDVNAHMDSVGLDKDYWNYKAVWGDNSNWCGQAMIGGNWSVTYKPPGANCGLRTMIHESIGHNFGCHHAGRRKVDGTNYEYGDLTSHCGSSYIAGIHGPHLLVLDLESEREKIVIEESQHFFLRPVELEEQMLPTGVYQHAILRVAGERNVQLSMRQLAGAYFTKNLGREDTVYLHEMDKDGRTKRLEPDMRPGDVRLLDNGMTVKFHTYFDGTASITVRTGDDTDTIAMVTDWPPVFPDVMVGASVGPEHNGAWHNESYPNQGFFMQIDVNRLVMYWYTYNMEGTGRVYMYGHALLTGKEVTMELYSTENGTWDQPATYNSVRMGTAQIYFMGLEHGVVCWDTEEYGMGSVEIVPTAPLTQHLMNCAWYQPDKNGSGYTMQFFDELQPVDHPGQTFCAAAWFGYDNRGDQRWMTYTGWERKDEPGIYDLVIYEYFSGRWMYFDVPDEEIVGSATMIIASHDLIKMEYDIDTAGIKEAGSFLLERVYT